MRKKNIENTPAVTIDGPVEKLMTDEEIWVQPPGPAVKEVDHVSETAKMIHPEKNVDRAKTLLITARGAFFVSADPRSIYEAWQYFREHVSKNHDLFTNLVKGVTKDNGCFFEKVSTVKLE